MAIESRPHVRPAARPHRRAGLLLADCTGDPCGRPWPQCRPRSTACWQARANSPPNSASRARPGRCAGSRLAGALVRMGRAAGPRLRHHGRYSRAEAGGGTPATADAGPGAAGSRNTLAWSRPWPPQNFLPQRFPGGGRRPGLHRAAARARATHDLLLPGQLAGASVRSPGGRRRAAARTGLCQPVRIDGDDVSPGPKAALSFALVLHELGTNAVKCSALSTPEAM